MFNYRINDNIPDENILNDDIKVDNDNRYKLIFTCKSEPNDIYKYVFHIFINKDFTYDIVINKFKYLKIEEKIYFKQR